MDTIVPDKFSQYGDGSGRMSIAMRTYIIDDLFNGNLDLEWERFSLA